MRSVPFAALALSAALVSPVALRAEEPCTPKTLQGQYVFVGRGFIEPVEPGVQRMHYGVFIFDGTGKFTGKQSSSRSGKIAQNESLQGTYTLDGDCTGTMTFGSFLNPGTQIHWDIFVTQDGRKGHMIRTDAGSMAVRSFER